MRRSTLKKEANNMNCIKLYKKQRNDFVSLSRKVKKNYFQKHMSHGPSSKNFWKFCKPFFTNQITHSADKIMQVEKEKVVSTNEEIVYLFNTYFSAITKGLNIKRWITLILPCKDPLVIAIRKMRCILAYLKSNQALNQ